MKTVLLDTNVILDVLLGRHPHVEAVSVVWAAAEQGKARAVLAAHALTTIHYLVGREAGADAARRTVGILLGAFGIARVDQAVLGQALQLGWPDFEDAVTAAAALAAGCDMIVTRDPRGFPHSPVRVVAPETAAALIA